MLRITCELASARSLYRTWANYSCYILNNSNYNQKLPLQNMVKLSYRLFFLICIFRGFYL